MIVLKHTGGASEAFSEVHEWMEKHIDTLLHQRRQHEQDHRSDQQQHQQQEDTPSASHRASITSIKALDSVLSARSQTVRQRVEDNIFSSLFGDYMTAHAGKEDRSFEAHELTDLFLTYGRRSRKIYRVCTILDPLSFTLGVDKTTEDKIALCLSYAALMARSGSSEQLDRESLESAWTLHAQLEATARRQWWLASVSAWTLLLLGLMSIGIALLSQASDTQAEKEELLNGVVELASVGWNLSTEVKAKVMSDLQKLQPVSSGNDGKFTSVETHLAEVSHPVWTWAATVVSVLSTLVISLSARFSFKVRWNKVESALQLLETHIFFFRTRCGQYRVVTSNAASATSNEGSHMSVSHDRSSREAHARKIFSDNVEQIYNSAAVHKGVGSCQVLRPYFATQKKISEAKHMEDLKSSTLLHIDQYVELRAKAVFDFAQRESGWLTVVVRCLESLSAILTLLAAAAAQVGNTAFATIALAVVGILTSIEKHHGFSVRLDASNAAETSITAMLHAWHAMEPLHQRSAKTIDYILVTTEGARLTMTNAITAGGGSSGGVLGVVSKTELDSETALKRCS
eukprot:TRINITY_DN52269_c0_g1_i1.p1 TRINITY_DN52269_c0_g1~~TRINITY_DN52269_c0_g1_i1.p1  ORF type:complete len:572 (+),score=75.68 TRINITY_DN52269_c0_g1_i1:258-1973(+)